LKAVVLGANGQLGSELVRLLGPDAAVPRQELSIVDANAISELLARRRPEFVFNCAAYNAVDRAETEGDLAYAVNGQGPHNVAVACRRIRATIVHFSTNFVFAGTQDEPYVEADEPAPLSVYGSSKLMGERKVFEAGAHSLVIRTAALYGGPRSFPLRILERARPAARLPVVSDQRVNPTYARDLAVAAVELAEQGATGIVHAVSQGCCGWDEFARAVLEEFGVTTQVDPVSSASYPAAARRPRNGCLGSTRYRPLRPWREAFHAYATEVLHAPPHSWGGQGRGQNP
jgi:dTDP-4-dehydrorhamnose reductase